MQRLIFLRPLVVILALCASVGVVVLPGILQSVQTVQAQGIPYVANFSGTPLVPTNFIPANWDVFVNGYETRENGLTVVGGDTRGGNIAGHGTSCEPPNLNPTTIFDSNNSDSHAMLSVADAVFLCNNHLMTAPGLTGYGAVYMNPPAMMDLSQGTATVSWHMSTFRSAARDWVDVIITPFDEYAELAYNNNNQHEPPDNIHVLLAGGGNVFLVLQSSAADNLADFQIQTSGVDVATDWGTVLEAQSPALGQSQQRRDQFQITLSTTHISVCMPAYNYHAEVPFCWLNNIALARPLDPAVWNNQATVQFDHRDYNPEKSCINDNAEDAIGFPHSAFGDANCEPDTWHWSDVTINPYVPTTYIAPISPFQLDITTPSISTVNFGASAPANAILEFDCVCHSTQYDATCVCAAAIVPPVELVRASTDHGSTYGAWTPVTWQGVVWSEENGNQVHMPIPIGTNTVQIQGQGCCGNGIYGAYGIGIRAAAAAGVAPPLVNADYETNSFTTGGALGDNLAIEGSGTLVTSSTAPHGGSFDAFFSRSSGLTVGDRAAQVLTFNASPTTIFARAYVRPEAIPAPSSPHIDRVLELSNPANTDSMRASFEMRGSTVLTAEYLNRNGTWSSFDWPTPLALNTYYGLKIEFDTTGTNPIITWFVDSGSGFVQINQVVDATAGLTQLPNAVHVGTWVDTGGAHADTLYAGTAQIRVDDLIVAVADPG